MAELKTVRGQSAKIVEVNGRYKIVLYSNVPPDYHGEWHDAFVYGGRDGNDFSSEAEAVEHFMKYRDFIHS